MAGLPLAFAAPWALAALVLLPVIWWLLRLMPPRPREVSFPPTRLLLDIDEHEETPQRSPWWLTLLRLTLAACLILALAGPIWRPAEEVNSGDGVLWLLLDNGWTSAKSWDEQVAAAEQLLTGLENKNQPVLFAATAEGPAQPLVPATATTALERLRALQPRAWMPNRSELIAGLRKAAGSTPPGAVIWLSDGTQQYAASRFQEDLASIAGDAPITVMEGLRTPKGLKALSNDADALSMTVVRHPDDTEPTVALRALDLKGLTLGQVQAVFEGSATETEARFELPSELRNDIARVEIVGENAAGAVQLIDDSWRRRTVGLVSGQSADLAQPLLSPLYYLQRALSPFSDIRVPREADLAVSIPAMLDQGVSVVILADVGRLPDTIVRELGDWISGGGILVRFAGPRMAGGTDDLIPVPLRKGDRSLGGSLSWKQPQRLADFTADSPFAGLKVPAEVTVSRQVLAEPTSDLPDRTWATLEDGTPLVTAAAKGRGTVVLFHVTGESSWSNLPLSGVFVDMLRRILAVSNVAPQGSPTGDAGAAAQSVLPPLRLLDGFGRFSAPPPEVTPVTLSDFRDAHANRKIPPGLYGSEDGFRALNLLGEEDILSPLETAQLGENAAVIGYPSSDPVDLRATFFSLTFLLLLADALIVILLAGGLNRLHLRRSTAAVAVTFLAFGLLGMAVPNAQAQSNSDDVLALESTLKTRLAYVITGNSQIDDASYAGLYGLTQFLTERTALEPGEPVGVDIDRDELSFYSLLYWPIDPAAEKPTDRTMARIDTFMRNGGTILFDTRDQLTASANSFANTPETAKLREILSGLDIPPLEPVPPDHVLTKAFYLLESFPGRYATGQLWVESLDETPTASGERPVRAGDGVSPILITGNDFAGAWAIDDTGNFLFPTVPDDGVQRDYAFRSGVNIVMYSLTGNYKADQVHIPALLERLGQ